jgi:hypothetical protein
MIEIVAVLLIVGVIVWAISAFPIPTLFRTLIYAVVAIGLIIWLAGLLGHPIGHLPR